MFEEVLKPKIGEVYVSSKRDSIYILDVFEDDVNIDINGEKKDPDDYRVFFVNEQNKDDLEDDEDEGWGKDAWECFVEFYEFKLKAL
jgi:hypothetical protein